MKTYLEDLRKELTKHKMTEQEIDEIIADHEEMIKNAMEDGLSEDQIETKFGDPKQVAEELADFEPKEEATQHKAGDLVLWQTFDVTYDFIKVNVRLVTEDITYKISDDDLIHIYHNNQSSVDQYELSFKNGELKLAAPKLSGFLFSKEKHNRLAFVIEIPKYTIINDLSHISTNSDVNIKHLETKLFNITTTNGEITIENATLGVSKWHTVNGDISVISSTFESLTSSQVSGDLEMKETKIENQFRINTVSGDIKIDNTACKTFDLNTVSGDLVGKEFYPTQISLKSVSGDIKLSNKEDRPIEILKKHSVSGDIKIN